MLKISENKRASYESMAIFDDHESTVTGVRLLDEDNASGTKRRLRLVTVSTDKTLSVRNSKFDIDQTLASFKEIETFEIGRKEVFEERIHSMDVTEDCGYILTAHDKTVQLLHITPRV